MSEVSMLFFAFMSMFACEAGPLQRTDALNHLMAGERAIRSASSGAHLVLAPKPATYSHQRSALMFAHPKAPTCSCGADGEGMTSALAWAYYSRTRRRWYP